MNIGAHISAAGGVENAPINAAKIGCECYQFFSRPPQGGSGQELTSEVIQNFKNNNQKFGYKNFYLHAPYYINFCSVSDKIYNNSIRIIRDELERGSKLGVKALMFHVGSAKDLTREQGIKKAAQGIKKVLKGYRGSCQLLIENSAGSKNVIGDSFEEIADILKIIKSKKVGICFDTAHAFGSGYDLRNEQAVKKTFAEFDKKIGLKRLVCIHINDSKVELGSHKDRHEHVGKGLIGKKGFSDLLKYKKIKNIDLILETPGDGREKDLEVLKKMRGK